MTQANNPLHGKTLEMILNELVAAYGWAELGRQIEIRVLHAQPEHRLQPQVPAPHAVGARTGRIAVHLHGAPQQHQP